MASAPAVEVGCLVDIQMQYAQGMSPSRMEVIRVTARRYTASEKTKWPCDEVEFMQMCQWQMADPQRIQDSRAPLTGKDWHKMVHATAVVLPVVRNVRDHRGNQAMMRVWHKLAPPKAQQNAKTAAIRRSEVDDMSDRFGLLYMYCDYATGQVKVGGCSAQAVYSALDALDARLQFHTDRICDRIESALPKEAPAAAHHRRGGNHHNTRRRR